MFQNGRHPNAAVQKGLLKRTGAQGRDKIVKAVIIRRNQRSNYKNEDSKYSLTKI